MFINFIKSQAATFPDQTQPYDEYMTIRRVAFDFYHQSLYAKLSSATFPDQTQLYDKYIIVAFGICVFDQS